MINVLFVCLGNICRSPMAEAVLKHKLQEEGLADKVAVDSAGTGDYHIGHQPHQGTRAKLDAYGISYEGLRARQVTSGDFVDFDYVLTMDDMNTQDLKDTYAFHDAKVCRFMDFVKDPKEVNVPDPYYTGDFDYTYELISQACEDFLVYLKEKHHIKG